MKLLILTGYDRNMAELAELCLPSKQAWADRHGVPLHVLRDGDFPKEHGHPSFQKLRHIRWHLERNDAVFWMDADSVITNHHFDPARMAETCRSCDDFLTVSGDYKTPDEDPRARHNQWSAGHAIWQNEPRSFALLDAAMAKTCFAWSGLWDQDAMQAAIPGPGRWAPTIKPTRYLNSVLPGLTGKPQFDWSPGDLLCHFTGIRYEDRVKVARQFIAKHLAPTKP